MTMVAVVVMNVVVSVEVVVMNVILSVEGMAMAVETMTVKTSDKGGENNDGWSREWTYYLPLLSHHYLSLLLPPRLRPLPLPSSS